MTVKGTLVYSNNNPDKYNYKDECPGCHEEKGVSAKMCRKCRDKFRKKMAKVYGPNVARKLG